MNEKVSTESVIEQIQQAIQEKINLVGRQSISIDNGVSALAINAKKHEHSSKTFYKHMAN